YLLSTPPSFRPSCTTLRSRKPAVTRWTGLLPLRPVGLHVIRRPPTTGLWPVRRIVTTAESTGPRGASQVHPAVEGAAVAQVGAPVGGEGDATDPPNSSSSRRSCSSSRPARRVLASPVT